MRKGVKYNILFFYVKQNIIAAYMYININIYLNIYSFSLSLSSS